MKPPAISLACVALVMWAFAPVAAAQRQVVGWGAIVVNSDWASGKYVEVAAGHNHTLARRSNGSVVAWGGPDPVSKVPGLPSGLTYGAFAAGGNHSVAIVSRSFDADRYELSLKQAGTQKLTLDAGKQHAGRLYGVFGSATGTSPGINLLGIQIPLNVDLYTNFTIGSAVPPIYGNFRGALDSNGQAAASFNVPSTLPVLPSFTLYHAYVVFDATGRFYMASNPVPLRLVN